MNLMARLPSEYQEVEYIASSGSQYLVTDITGDATWDITVQYTATDSSSKLVLFHGVNTGQWFGQREAKYAIGTDAEYIFAIDATQKIRASVSFSNSGTSATINGTTLTQSGSMTSSHYTLFGGLLSSYSSSVKVYKAVAYQNNEIVCNLVPAYKKSDNTIGMYDLVSKSFYTNSGSGAFTKGSDLIFVKNLVINNKQVAKIQDMQGNIIWKSGEGHTNLKTLKLKGDSSQTETPAPSSEAHVSVARGDQVITVTNDGTGIGYTINLKNKNLFNKNELANGYRINTNGAPYAQSNYSLTPFIPVKPSTNYYRNRSMSTYEALAFYGADKSFISRKTSSKKVTTTDATYFIRTDVKNDYIDTTQLEESSTETTYVDCLDIELCKIGTDYQDKIYNANNTWYLEKQVGKVILNGTESWTMYGTSSGNLFRGTGIITNAVLGGLPLCDYYHGIEVTVSDFSTKRQNGDVYINPEAQYIDIVDNTQSSAANFKTWLVSKGVTMYYPLSSPVITEITDSTLLDQLNTLLAAEWVENSTTTSVTGTLPVIIETEYEDSSENIYDPTTAPTINAYFEDGTPNITANAENRLTYIACQPNTTYLIKKLQTKVCWIGYTTTTPAVGVTTYGRVRTGNSAYDGTTYTNTTFSTGADAAYIVIRYIQTAIDSGAAEADIKNSIEIYVDNSNLFNPASATILNAYFETGTSTITANDGNRVSYIACQPNTTYDITKFQTSTFWVGSSSVEPAVGTTVNSISSGTTGSYDGATEVTKSYTTDANANYLVFRYMSIWSDGSANATNILNSIKITKQ